MGYFAQLIPKVNRRIADLRKREARRRLCGMGAEVASSTRPLCGLAHRLTCADVTAGVCNRSGKGDRRHGEGVAFRDREAHGVGAAPRGRGARGQLRPQNVADGWLRVRASRCRPHASSTADAELFVYPGEQHFFADASLDAYDPDASALLMQRVRAFLASI